MDFIVAFLALALFGGLLIVLGFSCYAVLLRVQNRVLRVVLAVVFHILLLPAMLYAVHYAVTTDDERRLWPFSLTMRVRSRSVFFISLMYVGLYAWLFSKLGLRLPDIHPWVIYMLLAVIVIAGIIVLVVRSVHRSRLIAGKAKPKPKKVKSTPVADDEPPLISPAPHLTPQSPPTPSTSQTVSVNTDEPSYEALTRAFEPALKAEYGVFSASLPIVSKVGRVAFDEQLSDLVAQYAGRVIFHMSDALDGGSGTLPSLWVTVHKDATQLTAAMQHLDAVYCNNLSTDDYTFTKGYAILYYAYLGEPCPRNEVETRLLRFNLYKNAAINKALGEG